MATEERVSLRRVYWNPLEFPPCSSPLTYQTGLLFVLVIAFNVEFSLLGHGYKINCFLTILVKATELILSPKLVCLGM